MITTILTFILVFSILVVFHEYGHYYFAKKSGILVREFAIGFGPKIFSYRKNETTYTVRLLPVGGYVRMAGYEEDIEIKPGTPISLVLDANGKVKTINTSKKKQLVNATPIEVSAVDLEKDLFIEGFVNGESEQATRFSVNRDALLIEEDGTEVQIAPLDVQFQSASLPQRMMTNFAGPMNNIILAIVAFIILAFIQGGVPSYVNEIGEVLPDSTAEQAGLVEGDKVAAIDGEKVSDWNEMVQIIQANPEEELVLSVQHEDGSEEDIMIVPETTKATDGTEHGAIGIHVPMDTSFWAKIGSGFTQTWVVASQIVTALASIFTSGFSVDMFGGPVAIYATTETVVATGFLGVLNWLAFLSVNLGIINLMPIPALDGGKLVLNIIEGVRGKPLSEEKEGVVTLIGVGLLLLLMLAVTWNDIQRYFL
ncbi:MAG: RIP metalloprotease RseP [Desemzia incerta]|uniref:RIP metalloprotease RseP n=1 Tax=Desemzia incerta TaxID=82801 RepID=UPI003315FB40